MLVGGRSWGARTPPTSVGGLATSVGGGGVTNGGWRVTNGGWRVAGGAWRVTPPLHHHIPQPVGGGGGWTFVSGCAVPKNAELDIISQCSQLSMTNWSSTNMRQYPAHTRLNTWRPASATDRDPSALKVNTSAETPSSGVPEI